MRTKIVVLLIVSTMNLAGRAFAQVWEELAMPGFMNYPCMACSADGTTLVALGVRLNIPIYVSTNNGTTWAHASAPLGSWNSVFVSANGRKLAASDGAARALWTSANGGVSWVSNSLPSDAWSAVAGSSDGNRLVAVNSSPGSIYTSTNSGTTWTQAINAPAAVWRAVACSADGTRLIVADYSGTIYTSADGGGTWTRCTNAPTATWWSVASSVDGRKLVAAGASRVCVSSDFGATWATNSLRSVVWRSCAVSADGSTLIICSETDPGLVYTSMDGGVAWESNSVPSKYWTSVATSADGAKLFAISDSGMVGGGAVCRLLRTPAPLMEASLMPGVLLLSWGLPSRDFVLQQSPDCAPGSWQDTLSLPTLNLTNLQYEITLPRADRAFYRLKSR